MPREAGGGQQAVGRADIVAIGEEQFVRFGKRHGGGNFARELELHHARIGLEVNEAAGALVLLARLGGAAQIDDGVGVAKQLHASLARHADVLLLRRIEEGPAIAEAVALKNPAENFEIARRVRGSALDRGIVHVGAVILDVVDVEAELSESEQVMKQLPDDPRERVPRREMQHDDFALALAVHVLRADLIPRRGLRLSAPARRAA